MQPIYLDYNATTPIAPKVQEAMLPFLAEQFGDPLSDHVMGRAAAQAVEDARSRVAKAIGAKREHHLLFTSGGAEGCHLAISGVVVQHLLTQQPSRVVFSGVEHECVTNLLTGWAISGRFDVSSVPCDSRGVISPERIRQKLEFADTALVCVSHADGVTGVIQPIAEIADACREHGALLLVDASASFGKIAVDVEAMGVDMLVLSGHKVYAPKGVGALYARGTVTLNPPILGDGLNTRAGTLNVPGVVALGAAAELATGSLAESQPRLTHLRNRLESQITEACGEAATIVAKDSPRLPNTSLLGIAGLPPGRLQEALPELLFTPVSAGPLHEGGRSACLDVLAGEPDEDRLSGAIRLSTGWYTTEEEIDRAASSLIDAWERLRG